MKTVSNHALDWSSADERAVDLIRVLAMDAVQEAGNGHPGTAMSLAPAVEYVQPLHWRPISQGGRIDIGAYQYDAKSAGATR